MTQINLFRYRVAVIRRGQDGLVADAALREHVTVHAPNAITAMLVARAVTGAAIALEPERIGEVEPAEPVIGVGQSGGCVVFA